MNILICGAGGFIGTNLFRYLSKNHKVRGFHTKDFKLSLEEMAKKIGNVDVIINLSGANIFTLWNNRNKQIIYESRVYSTRKLYQALKLVNNKPFLFINASGINIYDSENRHTEESGDFTNNFLSYVVSDWEKMALKMREMGIKVAIARFGIVIGKDGGIVKQLRKFIKSNLGINLLNKDPYFSFIHIDDLCRSIEFILTHPFDEMVFNITSPEPTTFNQFMKTFSKVYGRRVLIKIPGQLPKIFGENNILITEGQYVIPQVLLKHRFSFKYPDIYSALKSIK